MKGSWLEDGQSITFTHRQANWLVSPLAGWLVCLFLETYRIFCIYPLLWSFRSENLVGFDVPSIAWFAVGPGATHCLLTASPAMIGLSCACPCCHLGLCTWHALCFPAFSWTQNLPSFLTTSVLNPEGCFLPVLLLDMCTKAQQIEK